MKFGAIDIGTNAARLLVGEVSHEKNHSFVKKISYTRIPLRLGEEVFDKGFISEKKAEQFVKTIQSFKLISEIFDVIELRACATSAMREAENGIEIAKLIKKETNVTIDVISGEEEARLIFGTFHLLEIDKGSPFLVIDVGGGSTEISVFEKGQKIAARSFPVGTIRILKNKVPKNSWKDISDWVTKNVSKDANHNVFATGGNINKVHKMLGIQQNEPISTRKMIQLREELNLLTVDERVDKFQLKPDRADVIVPACDIYAFILKKIACKSFFVPKIGLSDGMIYDLYLKNS
jgi:exopolyphosphatase / guanosine-5'-triphosphate,3'-diphosphate pyrophosphatase